MRFTRLFFLLLLAGLLAGCTGQPAAVVAPKDTPKGEGSSGGTGRVPDTHKTVPPAGPVTLEGLIREAPAADLVKTKVTLGGLPFTLDAPRGATPVDTGDEQGARLRTAQGELVIRPWSPAQRSAVAALGRPIVDTPEALVVEAGGTGEAGYSFVTPISAGNVDLGVTFAGSRGGQVGLGPKADVLLLLKCARTLAAAEAPPPDPVAALEKLGATLTRDGDKVVGVQLAGKPVTRSALALLAKLPAVKTVDLGFLPAKGDDFAPLAALTQLETASFKGTAVGDEGLKAVGKLTGLRVLDLGDTHVTAGGLASLAGLKQLRVLKLDGNNLSGTGTAALADLTGLEDLSLYNTKVGDDALKAVGQLKGLRVLNLEECPVTDAGAAHLAGLANLEQLTLSDTKVGDAGLAHLAGLKKLKKVYLRHTPATDAGKDKLRKDLPDVEVR